MVTIDFGETSDFSKKISWIYKQHHYWYTHSKWQFFKALEDIVNNKGLKGGGGGDLHGRIFIKIHTVFNTHMLY